MTRPKILLDASSWINLFDVDIHEYLVNDFDVYTTSKVREEIRHGGHFAEDLKVFESFVEHKLVKIINDVTIPNELKHEMSITSGEIELAACAFDDGSFIVLLDDGKVYRIMERVGINFISSVNIVVDAYFTQHHDKKQAHAMLEKLRISFSDDVIDKAQEVIGWK